MIGTNTKKRVLKILDFNALFARTENAVLLNKFDFSTPGYAEKLAENIFSRSTDIDFVAKCECEHLVGNYYTNLTCPRCHTLVTCDMEAAEGHLTHKAWISCPDGIEGGWLNPAVYQIIARHLRYGKRVRQNFTNANGDISSRGKIRKGNYLDDILDFDTPIPDEIAGAVTGKGFSYFYQNFDRLMQYFLYSHKQTAMKKGRDTLAYFLAQNRDKLFCRYLPILASSLHPIVMSEGINDNRKRFVDKNSQYVEAAAAALSYLEFSSHRARRPDLIEASTFQAYQEFIAYTVDISTRHLSKKRSLPRQHIFASRLSFTFRGVIVSITGKHDLDELHMPWAMAVNLLRLHIVGRLMQRGMSSGDAMRLQQSSLKQYDPLIDSMMQEFIAESPYKGLPALFGRNPSIRAGSIQLLYITKIKTNIHDETIGFSQLATAAPNADYDGD